MERIRMRMGMAVKGRDVIFSIASSTYQHKPVNQRTDREPHRESRL